VSVKGLEYESNERLIFALREQFTRWGIRYAAWDVDGTLIDTAPSFIKTIADVADFLVYGKIQTFSESEPGSSAMIFNFIDEAIDGLRGQFRVNPMIMKVAVHLAALHLGLDPGAPRVDLAMARINRLYNQDLPPVFAGVEEAVVLIDGAVEESVLMTHAGRAWTDFKLRNVGLRHFFSRIACFSVDEIKSVQWQTQFDLLGIDPRECLVIGNNFRADILVPVGQLGACGVFIYRRGERRYDPESEELLGIDWEDLVTKTLVVGNIRQVIPAILQPNLGQYRLNPEELFF